MFINIHPEYYYFLENFNKFYIYPFSSELDNVLNILIRDENVIMPVFIITHIIITSLFLLFFIILYFSHYSSSVKEETTIDHDYLSSNATFESEEEVGSLDDILLGMTVLIFIFF